MNLVEDASALAPELQRWRETLHAHPEIGLHLPRTQERVLEWLDGLPLEISLGTTTTSVTAVLRGTASGSDAEATGRPVVLLRGDMDALPVQETADVPFRSQIDGAMHACGHDLHTSMLLGAAHLLSAHRDRLAGDVVFMFQPGEEGCDGASHMIADGVLDAAGRRADAAYALHVFSAAVPSGQFLYRPGTFLSAADELHVTVRGLGGHGSAPYRAIDPVPAVAAMVGELQVMVSREFDIFDPVVISVGSLHAGTKANVIPELATFEATVRSFSPEAQDAVMERSQRVLRGVAAAHGVEIDIDYQRQYPLTVNDEAETAFASSTIDELFGDGIGQHAPVPLSGSEDFSRVLAEVPGSFIGLGATPPGEDIATAPYNHAPGARFTSDVMPQGTALYAELAVRRLAAASAR